MLVVLGSLGPVGAALAGTRDWFVPEPRQQDVEGYTDEVGYLPGAAVGLYVNSNGRPFSFAVYRMGYEDGDGAREVLPAGAPIQNAVQPAITLTDDRPGGRKLELTGWHQSAFFQLPQDARSGVYLVKLMTTAGASYALFVVRAPQPAPVVVVLPTNTYQAYNLWHGLDLYRDLRLPAAAAAKQNLVAHETSFLRPYADGWGAGTFWRLDRPLVDYLERRGYRVSYATDADLRSGRVAGPATRLVILSSHSEYHGAADRSYLERLRDRGVSLAFFGGNDFIWQTRFDDTHQRMTVWRYPRLDPVKGHAATVRWENTGWPQQALTGEMQAWGTIADHQRAYAASSWPWRGAGVADGSDIGLPYGLEFDGPVPTARTPRGIRVLARTQLAANPGSVPAAAAMTLYPAPHGAFVFSAGQVGFNWRLAYPGVTPPDWIADAGHYPRDSKESPPLQRLVGNLIERATGFPNPEPFVATTERSVPFQIVAPKRSWAVPAAPGSIGVMWAGSPAGAARFRITLDGRPIGSAAPDANVWIGPSHALRGTHTLGLAAVTAGGRAIARRSVAVRLLPADASVFHGDVNHLERSWDDDSHDGYAGPALHAAVPRGPHHSPPPSGVLAVLAATVSLGLCVRARRRAGRAARPAPG